MHEIVDLEAGKIINSPIIYRRHLDGRRAWLPQVRDDPVI